MTAAPALGKNNGPTEVIYGPGAVGKPFGVRLDAVQIQKAIGGVLPPRPTIEAIAISVEQEQGFEFIWT